MTTDTLKEPVLTKVPRGHWRNIYRFIPGRQNFIGDKAKADKWDWIDEHYYYGAKKWPCKDSAETAALRHMAKLDAWSRNRRKYVTTKFFPGA